MALDIRQSLDHCVKCTICETFCPVANATPLFPGPKYVGPQAERFRDGKRSPDDSLDYCSGCGVCTQVCPQGVKIAEINAQARAVLKAERGVRLRDRIIARPGLLGRLGTPVAPLANWMLSNRRMRSVIERVGGIHRLAPVPRVAGPSLRGWRGGETPAATGRPTVAYFHGCSTKWFEPRLGQMTAAVLARSGVGIIVPTQGCCGLPLQSNGLFADARQHVRRLARALAPAARAGHDIVATSTSCGLMLKREAEEILGLGDRADVQVVSERVFDICEFLLDLHRAGSLDTTFRPLPLTVAYYAPCQQRGHGIGKPALDLLALVPELRVVDLDFECCGIAGTYGLKQEKYEIAMAVGNPLFGAVHRAAPDVVACDSETCRWQITHATGIPAVHPVELLHRAYGLDV